MPNPNKGRTKEKLKQELHNVINSYTSQFGNTWTCDALAEVLSEVRSRP